MLNFVGAESLEDLTAQIVPESIRLSQDLSIGDSCGEAEGIAYIRGLATKTKYLRAT